MSLFRSLSQCAALAITVGMSTQMATAGTIDPTDMRGIRESAGCAPLCLLDFSAVKGGTEDRTVAHFDLAGIGSYLSATLVVGLQNQDSFTSVLDFFTFYGDGTVDVGEFGSGTLAFSDDSVPGGVSTRSYDITSILDAAILDGANYLSFNIRNEFGEGRFFLSHVIGGTYGTISSAGPTYIDLEMAPVPVPAGLALLLTGLGALVVARRRS